MRFTAISARDVLGDEDVVELRNVLVENRSWIVVDGSRAIFPWTQHDIDTIRGRRWVNCNKFVNGEEVEIIGWDTIPRIKVAAACLIGGNSNYYHYTIDYLANLKQLEKLGSVTAPLLVSEDYPWQSELLSVYCTNGAHRLSKPFHCIFEIDKLVMPRKSFDFEGKMTDNDYFGWVRDKFDDVPLDANVTERIYFSRNRARCRRLANERELVDYLSRLGFKVIVPEELTISQQISHFQTAKLIVGPTGAGFTSIAYSKPGTTLIEFMPGETWRPPQIKFLCCAGGINYERIVCPGTFSAYYFEANMDALADLMMRTNEFTRL